MMLQADALHIPIADESVHTVVTSPPYWGLRDYGTAEWSGGNFDCDHRHQLGGEGRSSAKQNTSRGTQTISYRTVCRNCGARRVDRQLGLEKTPEEYVENIVAVFREVRRVLRKDGTLWINLGDSYNANQGAGFNGQKRQNHANRHTVRKRPSWLKPKDLVGIPWRIAFALQFDGWYLRSDIIWSKPNPMPESVTDRPTKAHEYIFLMSKSAKYYYDSEAIKEESIYPNDDRKSRAKEDHKRAPTEKMAGIRPRKTDKQRGHGRRHAGFNDRWDSMTKEEQCSVGRNKRSVWTVATQPFKHSHFATFPQKLIEPCILAGSPVGGVVLDPFVGSGTTVQVAHRFQRKGIGIDISLEYLKMIEHRPAQIEMFV